MIPRLGRLRLLAVCLLLAGCQSVAPWERARLAEPQMVSDPLPAQRFLQEHTYRSREAATGGGIGEGGGCGCY